MNLKGVLTVSYLYSLAINFVSYSLFCFIFIKVLSAKNKVLLVYRPIMLKGSLL